MSDGDRGSRSEALSWAFPLIGIILALAITWGLGFLSGQQEHSADTSYRYEHSAKERAQAECVGTEPGSVFECVVEKAETARQASHEAKDLKAQQQSAWAAMLSSVWSIGALIATFLGLVWIKATLDETRKAVGETTNATEAMREANEIAERNARRQMRPYVFVSRSSFTIDESGDPVAFVELKNFGQTPALRKESWTSIWVECFPLHDPLPHAPPDLPKGRTVVGPGATSEAVHPRENPLNEASRIEIEAGRAALYVYGKVTYRDIFGVDHWSEFTLFATGEGSLARGRLKPYSSGNIIDRNF